ncbi:hypothetical protein GGR51DRAFT_559805 [Nemania sp. FL0031]|nr:hypothetical protein GGR51DRAFT_559805 [Nemania sp. FL0031]
MSFGYAIGDVIAVLGLFERVAVELRNYKDAPVHFQQLSTELDLLRNTLRHVLQLCPETPEERHTLEKIRAIVIHCLQPLQALDAKMQAKQGSLGHFRTTGTLRVVGSRLHWSMIAQKDVDELRKTVLSEMVAINILLSVQQMNYIKWLSANVQQHDNRFSTKFDAQTTTLVKQTSTILNLVANTPDAIANLRGLTIAQAEKQEHQVRSLSRGMKSVKSRIEALSLNFSAASTAIHRTANLIRNIQQLILYLATCTKGILEAISRNTRLLLDITNHLKRIVRAVEAIPLHLTVGIIRFDDALGESWGLPIQACGSWDSFRDLLTNFIFVNGRAGTDHVIKNQFVINLSRTGRQIQPWDWEQAITAGAHIEQAMLIHFTTANIGKRCLRPGCNGSIVNVEGNRSSCSKCSQLAISQKKAVPVVDLLVVEDWTRYCSYRPQGVSAKISRPDITGPEPIPKMQVVDAVHCFHRVCITEPLERIQDVAEAYERLEADVTDAAANRCVGLHLLQNWENGIFPGTGEGPVSHLRVAAQAEDQPDAEIWYLLGRACLNMGYMLEAHNAFRRAVWREPRSPSIWITIGIAYYKVNQYRDSLHGLSLSLTYHPMIWQAWFNMAILYESCYEQAHSAYEYFKVCLSLKSDLPEVAARMKVIEDHDFKNVPVDVRFRNMRDCGLRTIKDMRTNDEDDVDIVMN